MTVAALMSISDRRIIDVIRAYVEKRPVIILELVYGLKIRFRTERHPAHGGIPNAGSVCF